MRHHLEVAAIAADHRDEFFVAREDPPHAGGMVLHGLELVLVEFEDALEGGDHLLDEAALDHLHVGNDPAAVFKDPVIGQDRKSTRELQSLMRISYAVFCLKKKTRNTTTKH